MPILSKGTPNAIHIPVDVGRLDGTLFVPEDACGLVLFANGGGSGHNHPANAAIASHLHARAIATLLIDLLTPVEDGLYRNRFDIALLSSRLRLATEWAHDSGMAAGLPVGYLGIGTGAAAAVHAAAQLGGRVRALVSRGGRPDLAGDSALAGVSAPTLLLVGGRDTAAIALNREACAKLGSVKQLQVIPGARNQFEEPGTLEQAAQQATLWFARHLPAPPDP